MINSIKKRSVAIVVLFYCLGASCCFSQANRFNDNAFIKYRHAFHRFNPFFDLVDEVPLESDNRVEERRVYRIKKSAKTIVKGDTSFLSSLDAMLSLDQVARYDTFGIAKSIFYYDQGALSWGYSSVVENDTLKKCYVNGDSVLYNTDEYILDNKGRPLKWFRERKTNYKYSYDVNGNLTEVLVINPKENKTVRSFVYEATEGTVAIKAKINGVYTYCFVYDSIGRQLEYRFYDKGDTSTYHQRSYFYNDLGVLEKIMEARVVDSNVIYLSDILYSYDLSNRLVEKLLFDFSASTYYEKVYYYYNKWGDVQAELHFTVKKQEELFDYAVKYEYEYY